MNLTQMFDYDFGDSIPRGGGGEPTRKFLLLFQFGYSPRRRG